MTIERRSLDGSDYTHTVHGQAIAVDILMWTSAKLKCYNICHVSRSLMHYEIAQNLLSPLDPSTFSTHSVTALSRRHRP